MLCQFHLDPSQWPNWAAPVIGGSIALVIIGLGLLLFMRPKEPPRPRWLDGPMVRSHERQPIVRANEASRGSDQRGTLRRGGNPVDVHMTDAEAAAPPRSALVLDRSLRGLCVAVDEPHGVGVVVCVRPARVANIPWVKVRIKNCRRVGTGYELGCEFVVVPSADVLIMFG